MDGARLLTAVLHDIDLATIWPTNRIDVISQHPECRPHSLPIGQLHACLDPTVAGLKFGLGLDAGRSIVQTPIGFLPGDDGQISCSIQGGILRPVRVVFQLIVAPTRIIPPIVKDPFGGIGQLPAGSVEGILPDQLPVDFIRTGIVVAAPQEAA